MKKFLLLVAFVLFSNQLFALTGYYMAPYGGGTFINLDNPEWSSAQDVSTNDGGANGAGGNVFDEERLIILGGIDGLESGFLSGDMDDYGISITFTSATYDGTEYFWFTKQSNPEFRRPFKIQIATRIFRDGWLFESNKYEDLGYMGEIDNEILEAVSDNLLSAIGDFFGSGTYFVVFEFGIVLPGDIDNGILSLDGVSYPIASGTDYSAEINVTVQLVNLKNNNASVDRYPAITFTVPFSGYYDPRYSDGAQNPDVDTSASLYVIPNARAANIDLLNNQGDSIPIAKVDFSIFNLPTNYENGKYDKSVFMFLSSSSNPFVSDSKGFRFVHEDVGFGDAETSANSIGYTISAIPSEETKALDDSDGLIHTVEYDGTDYLDISGSSPAEDKRMYTGHNEEKLGELFDNKTVHWHSYTGELVLNLKSNPVMMDSGLYKSTVYVHVVTDDGIGGAT